MPVRKMLENAIATDETVKKRIALQINWIPEYLPSMIICAPYHMFWSFNPGKLIGQHTEWSSFYNFSHLERYHCS